MMIAKIIDLEVQMAKNHSYMPTECKELCKSLTSVSDRYSTWQVFEDWLAMSAIAISNAVDLIQKDEREKQYLEIVKKYNSQELTKIAECLGLLVGQLDKEYKTSGITDLLGKVFHALNLHNEYHGQFFTPFHICECMGRMTFDGSEPSVETTLKEQNYISILEPCVGSGGLVLGFAKAMQEEKHNPQQELCVTAIDIDIKCVHMAYLQLSLFGIPAVVVHGNSLTEEQWSVWRTPAYILGFWEYKVKRHNSIKTEPTEAMKTKKETVSEDNSETNNVPPKFDIEYPVNRNGQMSLF